MRKLKFLSAVLSLFLLPVAVPAVAAEAHTFRAANGQFQLDGKPFQIISGSIHYPRVPRAYWKERLEMAKAMGLNTVTAYTFWNVHEPRKGVYDFSGNNDVAEFVREAQREGLYVILRPGPYVCAEWELGGFPAWLIKDPSIRLRTTDPKYMVPVRQWLKRLGRELAPLQLANGGPIIAVQVENEYGSYGSDKNYMREMRQAVIDAGFDKTLLYTSDPAKSIPNGSLPGMLSGVNFGAGVKGRKGEEGFAAKSSIDALKKLRPVGPYLVGEYWDGWFDHWGDPWVTTDGQQQATELEWMLRQGYSVSIYMFIGGTSFGWMNGANSPSPGDYEPDVTSYGYDAALKEDGEPSPKYYLFRDAIRRATGKAPPPMPKWTAPIAMPPARFTQSVSLWDTLPTPHHSVHPLTMEDLNQAYGYILYRTRIDGPIHGDLAFGAVHEYAQVYLNGKLAGTVDRRLHQDDLAIESSAPHTQLDILVEDTGRINFGPRINGERIGIIGDVRLAGKVLTGWDIYSLPMTSPGKLSYSSKSCSGACFYRATLHVDKVADTYLDTRELSKGEVWVNGRNLGRFWYVGPQGALYLPASWLHAGANDVVVFDLNGKPGRSVRGLSSAITDLTARATK